MCTWSIDHLELVTFEAVSEDASIEGIKLFLNSLHRCQVSHRRRVQSICEKHMEPTWHTSLPSDTGLRKIMSNQMHENRRIKGQNDYKDDNVVKRRFILSIWLTTL